MKMNKFTSLFEPINKTDIFNKNIKNDENELLNGSTSNVFNLENVKYKWAYKLNDVMLSKLWRKEDVTITSKDINDYKTVLTKEERYAVNVTLSQLIALDSIQTNSSAYLTNIFTSPEIKLCLATQSAVEGIHSDSYQYLLQKLKLPTDEVNDIYNLWKDEPLLKKKLTYITDKYSALQYNPTLHNLINTLIMDLVLEGIYFYHGFQLFYLLASQGKLVSTSTIFKLINRDEKLHINLYMNLLKELKGVVSDSIVKLIDNRTKEIIDRVRQMEYEWNKHIFGNGKILGFNNNSIEQYIDYVIDKHLNNSKDKITNPYKHLEEISNIEETSNTTTEFLGQKSSDYFETNALSGLDNF
jgi:ribonucleoside-diphosphate reductase beta chain